MSLRVVARQSFQCMRGSQAYVLGAQLGCGRRHANRAAAGSTTRFQPQRPSWARRRGLRGELFNAEPMDERRVQLATGLHKRQYTMLALSGELQLTASPRAHAASRDSHLAAHGCRDVTDGASGSSAEPQGARSTSKRGAQSLCILSTYPYHGYGVAGPVTGAPPGLWGDTEDPDPIVWDQGGKRVNNPGSAW